MSAGEEYRKVIEAKKGQLHQRDNVPHLTKEYSNDEEVSLC